MRVVPILLTAATLFAVTPVPASGQSARSAPIVEGGINACLIGHHMWNVGARFHVWPRLALGPEIIKDRYDNWTVLGEAMFDLRRSGRVMPYARVGAGVTTYQSFGPVTTGAFTGGVGVLIPLGDYLFVAPESRLLVSDTAHPVIGVVVGVRLH